MEVKVLNETLMEIKWVGENTNLASYPSLDSLENQKQPLKTSQATMVDHDMIGRNRKPPRRPPQSQ